MGQALVLITSLYKPAKSSHYPQKARISQFLIFPIIPQIPKMGKWGIFNLSGKKLLMVLPTQV